MLSVFARATGRVLGPKPIRVLITTLSYVVLGLGAVVMAGPFFWMVSSSLQTDPELISRPPVWIPKVPQWGHYVEVIQRFPFVRYTLNSTKIAVLAVIGQVLTCSMAAYCFARFEFPGRNVLFMILLATLMVPGQVTLIPQFLIMRALGWIDTHYSLIVPSYFGGAFGTFLLRQFFLTLPSELEDAARIDGAGRFAIYWRIFLPLCRPALATLAVLNFMGSWNNLLGPVIYLQTQSKMTLPVGLAMFRGQYGTEYALLNTGATISLIPILILFIAAQKYFVQGLTMTGLKA